MPVCVLSELGSTHLRRSTGCLEQVVTLGWKETSLLVRRSHHDQRRGFPCWAKHAVFLLLLSQPVYFAAYS